MTIDRPHIDQLDEILSIFKDCMKAMEDENIFQWDDHYPNVESILDDIHNGSIFCINQNGKCLGVISINNHESPEYKTIDWCDKNGKIIVIHRLAVSPLSQKKGVARQLMDFAEDFASSNNFTSIRLDAYSGNPRALKFYENRGYIERGKVNFPGKQSLTPYICFEKLI